jgi:chromate transporter
VDRLTRVPRIRGALAAVTAAVVGVIATLALLLAQVVIFPEGGRAGPDLGALALSVGAAMALERLRWPLPAVLAVAAVAGLALRFM